MVSHRHGSPAVLSDHSFSVSDILRDAHDAVESCQCEEGCAACQSATTIWITFVDFRDIGIDSPSCKEGNLVSSKTGALIVLKAIQGHPIDVDLIPEYPPEISNLPSTVVQAPAVRTAPGVEVEEA